MFGNTEQEMEPPVSSSEFKSAVAQYPGSSLKDSIGSAVDRVWPVVKDHSDDPEIKPRSQVDSSKIAPTLDEKDEYKWFPSYREHQRDTVIDVVNKMYIRDNEVVLLSAPTGAGKSLLIDAVASVVDEVVDRKSFITTPLNTLIDQIDNDELLDDSITIKGRGNYSCVHPQDAGTPVDQAICQRQDDFDCHLMDQHHESGGCPYYGRKSVAKRKSKVVTNLSFLMANSMIPETADAGFNQRELLAVDECQNIEDFVLMFVGFSIGPHTIPIDWEEVPDMPSEDASEEEAVEWVQEVRELVLKEMRDLEGKRDTLSFNQKMQEKLDDLKRFNRKANNFISDVKDHHWARTHTSFSGTPKIEFEPVFVGRFLEGYLWSQSNRVLASSATIPPNFLEEVGLDDRDVARVEVPSTFPKERRPVITSEDVGKMTYYERDKTIPKMADQIGRIADLWEGHKGIVHANSYSIGEKLYDRLPGDVQKRTRLQDSDEREESLQEWMDSDPWKKSRYTDGGGQVFISVAQEEGISLDHDTARFNVVAKVSYPHMQDERVSYRMDEDTMGGADWQWYNSSAAIDLQQAAGRTMRAKDDWSATYLLDSSAVDLVERNPHLFEDWFQRAVDCDFDESVVSPENGGTEKSDVVDRTGDDDLDSVADQYFG